MTGPVFATSSSVSCPKIAQEVDANLPVFVNEESESSDWCPLPSGKYKEGGKRGWPSSSEDTRSFRSKRRRPITEVPSMRRNWTVWRMKNIIFSIAVEWDEAPSLTRRNGRRYGEDDRGRHGFLDNIQSRSPREDRCNLLQPNGNLRGILKEGSGY